MSHFVFVDEHLSPPPWHYLEWSKASNHNSFMILIHIDDLCSASVLSTPAPCLVGIMLPLPQGARPGWLRHGNAMASTLNSLVPCSAKISQMFFLAHDRMINIQSLCFCKVFPCSPLLWGKMIPFDHFRLFETMFFSVSCDVGVISLLFQTTGKSVPPEICQGWSYNRRFARCSTL